MRYYTLYTWIIHLFGWAVKRERRKGSSRWQQTAYGTAVKEVAPELLSSARSPKRENGGRRYIKHDETIASPVGFCLCCGQLPLSPPVPPLSCSAPHSLSLSLSLSLTRFDAVKDVIVLYVHNMLQILGKQPRHLGYHLCGFSLWFVGFPCSGWATGSLNLGSTFTKYTPLALYYIALYYFMNSSRPPYYSNSAAFDLSALLAPCLTIQIGSI